MSQSLGATAPQTAAFLPLTPQHSTPGSLADLLIEARPLLLTITLSGLSLPPYPRVYILEHQKALWFISSGRQDCIIFKSPTSALGSYLDFSPSSVISWLCDLGQVTSLQGAPFSSFVIMEVIVITVPTSWN